MARVDWAYLCDAAFFDQRDRLCTIGVIRNLVAPGLPFTIHQMVLVAHLAELSPVEEMMVSMVVVTPGGCVVRPMNSGCVDIEVAHEYVLVTVRDLPLTEEGVYKFGIAIAEEHDTFVDVPVLALNHSAAAGVQ